LEKLIVSLPVKKFLAFCEIQKAYHRVPAVTAVSQMSKVHAIAFFKTSFSITVSSMPRSSKRSLSSGFPTKTLPPHPTYTTYSTRLILLDLFTVVIFKRNTNCTAPYYVSSSPPVTPSLFIPSDFLNPLSLCYSPNVTGYVSHSYKPRGKINVLYI